jgi:hypothetical protein
MNTELITQPELPIEATTAARWWADKLRFGCNHQVTSPSGRTKDTDIIEALTTLAGNRNKHLTPEQIDQFEAALAAIVTKVFIETDSWQRAKRDPHWGSATRTLSVDYGPCDELRAAYQFAGGPLRSVGVFPLKTVMWINPGSVKVRYGYHAAEVELIRLVDEVEVRAEQTAGKSEEPEQPC